MFSSHLWFAFFNKKKNLAGQTVEFRHKFSIKITCLDSLTNIYVWKLHTSIYVQLSNCWLPKLKLPSRSSGSQGRVINGRTDWIKQEGTKERKKPASQLQAHFGTVLYLNHGLHKIVLNCSLSKCSLQAYVFVLLLSFKYSLFIFCFFATLKSR